MAVAEVSRSSRWFGRDLRDTRASLKSSAGCAGGRWKTLVTPPPAESFSDLAPTVCTSPEAIHTSDANTAVATKTDAASRVARPARRVIVPRRHRAGRSTPRSRIFLVVSSLTRARSVVFLGAPRKTPKREKMLVGVHTTTRGNVVDASLSETAFPDRRVPHLGSRRSPREAKRAPTSHVGSNPRDVSSITRFGVELDGSGPEA